MIAVGFFFGVDAVMLGDFLSIFGVVSIVGVFVESGVFVFFYMVI